MKLYVVFRNSDDGNVHFISIHKTKIGAQKKIETLSEENENADTFFYKEKELEK